MEDRDEIPYTKPVDNELEILSSLFVAVDDVFGSIWCQYYLDRPPEDGLQFESIEAFKNFRLHCIAEGSLIRTRMQTYLEALTRFNGVDWSKVLQRSDDLLVAVGLIDVHFDRLYRRIQNGVPFPDADHEPTPEKEKLAGFVAVLQRRAAIARGLSGSGDSRVNNETMPARTHPPVPQRSCKRRRCYDRDHTFLRWYEAEGDTTFHSPAAIRDKWNREHSEEEQISGGAHGLDSVEKAIKRAKRETGENVDS